MNMVMVDPSSGCRGCSSHGAAGHGASCGHSAVLTGGKEKSKSKAKGKAAADTDVAAEPPAKHTSITNSTNKKFDTLPEHLRLNGVTPSGNPRLFVCKICTRAFARQEHLTRHERSHTKEKPYVCGICGRRFTRRDLLIRHCQKLHGGNCGDYIQRTSRKPRKDSIKAAAAAESVGSANEKKPDLDTPSVIPSTTKKRVRKRSSKVEAESSTVASVTKAMKAAAATATVSSDKTAAHMTNNQKMQRRVSFSAQSGGNYAVMQESAQFTEEKPERVDFSTPQMLPLDLFDTVPQLDEPTDFNLLDRNNWINDFNNAVIPGAENDHFFDSNIDNSTGDNSRHNYTHSNSVSDASPGSNSNNTRNSSWELQGDTLKINSLFSFPMSQADSHHSVTDWKSLATSLKPTSDEPAVNSAIGPKQVQEEVGGHSVFRAADHNIEQAHCFHPESSDMINTEEITNSLHNFQFKFNGKANGHDEGRRDSVDPEMSINVNMNMNMSMGMDVQINPVLNNHSSSGNIDGVAGNVSNGNHVSHLTGHSSTVDPNLTSNSAPDSLFTNTDDTRLGSASSGIVPHKATVTHNGIPTESPPVRADSNLEKDFRFVPPPAFTPNEPMDVISSKRNSSVKSDPLFTEKGFTFDSLHNDIDNTTNNTLRMKTSLSPFSAMRRDPNLHHNDIIHDHTISSSHIDPVQLQSIMDPGYTFYDVQYSDFSDISKASPKDEDIKISFFNDKIRHICESALLHYSTICGSDDKPCSLSCSNDELNTYLKLYVLRFNTHNPFIHQSVWSLDHQSYRSYIYEQDASGIPSEVDELNSFTNIICLPLFAATIGSLYKNTCSASAIKTRELYEVARRVLHVYLDRRKNLKRDETTFAINSNLWLIQSLTLSVMYSIFAEKSASYLNRSNQILKQVGAVCSLLRSYFLPLIQTKPPALNSEAAVIVWESKLRTALTNYNLCQFLQVFYRMSSSSFITNSELEKILLPSNEARWSSLSFSWKETVVKSDRLHYLNFLEFFQSFQFNDLGYHKIPEVLIDSILFYEYSLKLAGSNINVFINKIDTKKLEKNLPQVDPSSLTSDSLIGGSVSLKNSLISLRLFDKLDQHFYRIISKYGLTDDVFENCISPIHANILSKDSDSLILDLLVSVNVSIKNIASLFYFTNETGYYQEIQFDYSKTSVFQVQGYFFNFLCLLKFILDFEATPNFKLLGVFAEVRKLVEQLMIPKLINNYPLEFTKFPDLTSRCTESSPNARAPNPFNLKSVEKTIESVLVQSFNDYNYLKMPSGNTNSLNEFEFDASHSEATPVPSKSSINLLRHHETCKQNGARIRQGFYDRYHLSDKLLQVAKCSFLLIYESHVHGSLLANFIELINTLQSKLEDQRKITNIIVNDGTNLFGNGATQNNDASHPFAGILHFPNSNTPPGDYYFNPNSL